MPYLSFAGNFRFTVDVPDGITSFTSGSPLSPSPSPPRGFWPLSAWSASRSTTGDGKPSAIPRLD